MGYQPGQTSSPALNAAQSQVTPQDLQQFYAMASGAAPSAPSLTPDQVDPALLAQLMGTPAPQSQMDQVTANQLAMMGVQPPSDPNGFTSGPDTEALDAAGQPLNLPPTTGAANTYGGAPAPDGSVAQDSAPQQVATAMGFPQFADWAKASGLPRQVMPDERKVILEKYLDQQKDFLARQDPEKLLKLKKDTLEIQKSSMEQADAVAKKVDAIPEVQNNIQLLDDLVSHKGLSSSVGAKDAAFLFGLKSEPLAGTDAANFMERVKQVQGKNFLTAFNQLKGAGQITEIEGAKAQAALGRLGTNQSEEEFKNSVGELRGILQTGLERSKARLGNQAPSDTATTTSSSAPTSAPASFSTARPATLNLKGAVYQLGSDGTYHRAR